MAKHVWVVWVVCALWSPAALAQDLGCEEFCGDAAVSVDSGGPIITDCWDEEFGKDRCNPDIPEPCEESQASPVEFLDDQGVSGGQLLAIGNKPPHKACGIVRVNKTGYYRIFDTDLAESCESQKDETGYLTIKNSCNSEGWALEANVGKRYVVLDNDNTGTCQTDADCGAGMRCRPGKCCVPEKPTHMGTFLLVAGEDNEICINHFCPEWKEAMALGTDLGFITAGCTSPDSIHFQLGDVPLACEDLVSLKPCADCVQGQCIPPTCDTLGCPNFCVDGQCTDTNPCSQISCTYGCKDGLCLQAPTTPGVDADGDGFPVGADCNDAEAAINPSADEICGNGVDENCNGNVDETPCIALPSSGCGCRVANGYRDVAFLVIVLCALVYRRRRARG